MPFSAQINGNLFISVKLPNQFNRQTKACKVQRPEVSSHDASGTHMIYVACQNYSEESHLQICWDEANQNKLRNRRMENIVTVKLVLIINY